MLGDVLKMESGVRRARCFGCPASRPPQEVRLAAEVNYVKSALAGDRAAQIAHKLDAAMLRDRLYREAGLSLGDLSRYIGVMPNYVLQTLNERLGLSFFDHLNP
ncbi:hypothetical protein [Jannaschia marina]|uniref:hypothetical protein n=1 Tax=Jannaschia marina TaxID=2741674 RepID=UPI0015CEED9A|nr:hypothetical protein [Jannaschia marina]